MLSRLFRRYGDDSWHGRLAGATFRFRIAHYGILIIVLAGMAIGATCAGAARAAQAARAHGHVMEGRADVEQKQGQLRLSGDEFWTNPYKTRKEIQTALVTQGKEALLVDAPGEVRIDVHDTAPIVVLWVATNATSARLSFQTDAILTAVDLQNNFTYAGRAVVTRDRGGETARRGLSQPPQEGMRAEALVLDLRQALDIPWHPADYLVTLILRDQASDRLRIRLIESEAKYQDPEVSRFRDQERMRTDVPPISPKHGEPYPNYKKNNLSPALPQPKGINLSAPRLLVRTEKEPCVLRGAMRLPVLHRHIVPQGPGPRTGAGKLLAQLGKDDPIPTGVVPITLVATGSASPVPFVWRLVVPTYDPMDFKQELPAATAYFAIDLQTLGNVKGIEQTLFVYAFSDEAMAGPIPIAFVDSSVPKY